MTAIRICFVGDSILLGIGDEGFLGWPGQLAVAEAGRGHDVTVYNASIRGETSAQIAPRWRAECTPRVPDHVNGALVFAFGLNDTAIERGMSGPRVPLDRSVRYAREILGAAKAWLPTLAIGPVPTTDDMMPYVFPNGIAYSYSCARTAGYNAAYAASAKELGVPYLDVFGALSGDATFMRASRECDGVHVRSAGYGMIARMVGAWPAWRSWLDK